MTWIPAISPRATREIENMASIATSFIYLAIFATAAGGGVGGEREGQRRRAGVGGARDGRPRSGPVWPEHARVGGCRRRELELRRGLPTGGGQEHGKISKVKELYV